MSLEINAYRTELVQLCETFGVRRLEVFGSASRDDFDFGSSDIDFLVDLAPHSLSPFEQYFGLKEALEQLFGRAVDLVEEKAIKNPYFRQAIARDRSLVYGTGS